MRKDIQNICDELIATAVCRELQVPQAMSKFSQVPVLESLHGLLRSLCGICIIQSPIVYYLNMAWEPKTLSVCWCRRHCCQWQQCPFLICVLSSSVNRILWRQYYFISALDPLATHKPRANCCRSPQSWDLCSLTLLRLLNNQKRQQKAQKASNTFTVLLMASAV